METFRYLSDVTTLALDEKCCVGCGMCVTVCPHGVLALKDGKARVVDRDGCMECGACATNCPVTAVHVTPGVGCAEYIINSWIKGKGASAGSGARCC